MSPESMLHRFQGEDGRRRLVDLLRKQIIVGGDEGIASELANAATLRELSASDILIRQEAVDNDLYLVLAGSFRVLVNGREVARRGPGEHVGEMCIIDPALPRTATVIAADRAVVAKVGETDLHRIAKQHSYIWQALALELCRRLAQRKRFHPEPNSRPIVFIGSSKERLPLAEALAAGLPSFLTDTALWSDDVFAPSHFTIDDLDAQLRTADFAILVAGDDDQVVSRGITSDAPRDNVVFELGLFMGALSRHRTFLIVPKGIEVKIPSDLLGLTRIFYDEKATDPAAAVNTAVNELVAAIERMGPK